MRWIAVGAVAVVVFDIIWALVVRPQTFEDVDTTFSTVIDTAIYAVAAFLAARESGKLQVGVAGGAVVALADATVGWAATWVIGPGAIRFPVEYSPGLIAVGVVFVVIVVTVIGGVTGFIAGVLAVRLQRRQT